MKNHRMNLHFKTIATYIDLKDNLTISSIRGPQEVKKC